MVHDLTHARHEPGHVLAPGLFRSLGRGDRKRQKLDVTYMHGADQLEFKGFEPLGADDMRVLQGLVAMAGPGGLMLRDDDTLAENAKQLMLDLFTPPDAIVEAGRKPETIVVRDSFRRLAREIGLIEGGDTIKRIRTCIERLVGVTVFVQVGKRRTATRLLSGYASDEGTGDLYVALNPRLTAAIMGDRQHIRIEMSEVRGLNTDPARLLHQRLCGWIDPGKSGRVSLDKLCGYVWPEPALTDSSVRKRRATIRKALTEIRRVGWRVSEGDAGMCLIARPSMDATSGPNTP